MPYVRTGYDAILPIRVGNKFVTVAKDDGVVEEVTNNYVTVNYKGKKEKYKLYSWTTKEEAGACYTHQLVSNVAKGDKVSKDDTITYDRLFFQPDLFNPKRVVYKQGSYANVAIVENQETNNDSGAISKKMAEKLSTVVTKIKSIRLSAKDAVYDLVKIGDEVTPSSPLFSFIADEDNTGGIDDDEILRILKDIKTQTPKAKVKGVVKDVIIYYNCDFNNLSKTLQACVNNSNVRLQHKKGYAGRVDASYSIRGIPLQENEVEIKIYIDTDDTMSLGDKAIFGNQLKFTIGSVFEDIQTERGEEVDATFGFISIQNRIVNSPNLIGTTSSLIKVLQDKAVKMYFED